MKKAVLFLLFILAALQMQASVGHGYISVYRTDGTVDSIAVDGIYKIGHSKKDLNGVVHADFVTMVITTEAGERRYLISEIEQVLIPGELPGETIRLTGGMLFRNAPPRRIYFNGTFPPPAENSETDIVYRWQYEDSIYIKLGDETFKTKLESMSEDSTYAAFETFQVETEKMSQPVEVFYPGWNAPAYNKVRIARVQEQDIVDDSKHIAYSGDCATDVARSKGKENEGTDDEVNIYEFDLHHHPAFLAFLAHNDRLPSVKLRSVTMITEGGKNDNESRPISGTFTFSNEGIDLASVENPNDTITLKTRYFWDDGWKHTPRMEEHMQDSTAAYMVVAPQKDVYFKLIFNVVDTLSLIDTTFVKRFYLPELRANTFYTINAEVPDTLFSIVDLGLGDIKYAFRNVEAFFERGPLGNYGGAFAYGESNQKNNYDPGWHNDNYRGGTIDKEFTPNYDQAYQRWGGCWRMPAIFETDSLLKYCKTEWIEYNGVEGALVTGPSGKRIFLPINDNVRGYWSVDRTKSISDFYHYIPGGYGAIEYHDIPYIGIDKNRTDSVIHHAVRKFYEPGFARGVIEYSNYIKSGVEYDGSLVLQRYYKEEEVNDSTFAITGILRDARPWPNASTSFTLPETGFIFGTDSATLYFDTTLDKVWTDSLFIKEAEANDGGGWRPVGTGPGCHLKLVDGSKYVGPYESGQGIVRVNLSTKNFLGYLDKDKKYYARQYFRIGDTYYYASGAHHVEGFFPHTDEIYWRVGDNTATVNGHIVGVSAEVVGYAGFIISDSIKSETEYEMPVLGVGELVEADGNAINGGVATDMTFKYTIGAPGNMKLDNKRYYFVRAVFITYAKDDYGNVVDTTLMYAPEVSILHPLDTIDLGLGYKWANIDVRAIYPEMHDSMYVWNNGGPINPLITDIAGTEHDVVFNKWFGREGWLWTLPTVEQMSNLLDSCAFEPMTRFGEKVLKVTGADGVNSTYMPYYESGWYNYSPYWTSQRPWKSMSQAYYGGYYHGPQNAYDITNTRWVRPVLQTNCEIDDHLMFISTDTVGMNADHTNVAFYGRVLGVTPEMKSHYGDGHITRGFVLHDYKGGTLDDSMADTEENEGHRLMGDMPDTLIDTLALGQRIYNGLYSVVPPQEVLDRLRSDKTYWYRAYIKICDGANCEVRYGEPKKLMPLTIDIDNIYWEVHENKATLSAEVAGTIFIKNKFFNKNENPVTVGFIVGDSANIDMENYESKWLYQKPEGEDAYITDGKYRAVMDVPVDTVYWVRAFIYSDGHYKLSDPRQFGLDYVDLGLPSKSLWANLNVGGAYPEDDIDYFAVGEGMKKDHYQEKTYIENYYQQVQVDSYWDEATQTYIPIYEATTHEHKKKELTIRNNKGNSDYTLWFNGAEKEKYNCEGERYWKAYSGTKNDASYVNWGNTNVKFNDANTYIKPTKYGDLFVEPDQKEWEELRDNCTWTLGTENGVDGWYVKGKNGNQIFLPFKGHRHSDYRVEDHHVTWPAEYEYTYHYGSAGFYHVSDGAYVKQDSIKMVSLNASSREFFDTPSTNDSWTLTWGEFYDGFAVRPIARYNLPLTKNTGKLRDETLVWLNTDTCYYLNYRTAVALQGSYRINWPEKLKDANDQNIYEVGFVVGERDDVTTDTKVIPEIKPTLIDNSQYFAVLDNNDNLESDKTYYYRFFLHITSGDMAGYYYATRVDTFHFAKHTTGEPTYQIYATTATVRGKIEGVMAHEASSGYQAGILVGETRDLTINNKLTFIDKTSEMSANSPRYVGPMEAVFTLPHEGNYFFRTYVRYNNRDHYGPINMVGYKLVDLGLPSGTLWASMNLGSNNVLDGTKGSNPLNDSYGVSSDSPYAHNHSVAGYYDRALKQWHNVYRQPYTTEAEELKSKCTWITDTINGIAVAKVIGPNGDSIFIRHSQRYYEFEDDVDYNLGYGYLNIDPDNDKQKLSISVSGVSYHSPGCAGYYLTRPVFTYTHVLPEYNGIPHNDNKIVVRTDDAIVHSEVNNVSFFGSFYGKTQQRWGEQPYSISNMQYTGFVVGTDTTVTHNNEYFTYDYPHTDVRKDSIYFYHTANINYFKIDSTYWVRAYVKIGDDYYYGRSIKFVRQPNIITGDVEWKVGQTTATLHGNVKGFNNNINLNPSESDDQGLVDMDQLAKSARVGIIVGYKHDLTADDPKGEVVDSIYDLGQAYNGAFSIVVDYKKDTTYYYRAFVQYDGQYVYGKTGRYGLEFIDLGLPMMWASISVGNRFAEDANYSQFAWGETDANKGSYLFSNYKYYYSSGDDEYNNLGNELKGTIYDAAHVLWDYDFDKNELYGGRGATWSMPSEEDLQMLVDSCVWTDSVSYRYEPQSNSYNMNVKGYKVTGKNGNSIFIQSYDRVPQWTISGSHSYRDGPWEYAPLWTSSRAPRDRNAFGIQAGSKHRLMKYHYRYHGHLIRPMAYINVTLKGSLNKGMKMSISTERTSWVAGESSATLYGTVLGLKNLNASTNAHYGFYLSLDKDNWSAAQKYECKTPDNDDGLFRYTVQNLSNDQMYYYRAYLEVDGEPTTYYGDVKEFGIIMVDLGLPSGTKWANVNMGSWKEKDHGDYYGWGETTTKDAFSEPGYKYFNAVNQSYRELSSNISGNDSTDVANKFLGGLWRMPGDEEWRELIQQCDWEPDTISHVPGVRIKSKSNGNSIFLPNNYYNPKERDTNYDYATSEDGYQQAVNHDDDVVSRGYYWSSNRATSYKEAREVCFIDSASVFQKGIIADNYRWRGNAIRPVAQAKYQNFYVRTESTDWRYKQDTIRFYSVVLNMPKANNYTTGFAIGTTDAITQTNAIRLLPGKQTKDGSGGYVGVLGKAANELDEFNDGVWYYRAYVTDGTQYWWGDARQFGFVSVDLGTPDLTWSNINVDAASPEQIGLNGVPTGEYATADPANVEFGSLWRTPTDAEKELLLDGNNFIWSQVPLYGTSVYKVTSKADNTKYIYLTSNNPDEWGYRPVAQFNTTLDDDNKIFLRTDSTNWRAGYTENNVYASIVGSKTVVDNIQERGFIITTTDDAVADGASLPAEAMQATDVETGNTMFSATLPQLPIGTYYYHAFIKYGDKYYFAPNAKPVGIDFVDLGLPSGVQWATVSVGGQVPSDAADHYQWGDTEVRSEYTQDSYPYHTTKGYTDIGADISASDKYDVAAIKIPGSRMPNSTELSELLANCSWTTETLNGVPGYRVTSAKAGNTNSIFLPLGNYWTATKVAADNSQAYYLKENSENTNNHTQVTGLRYLGMMVRPVISMVATIDTTNVLTSQATLIGMVNVSSYDGKTIGFQYSRKADMTADVTDVTVQSSEVGQNKQYRTTVTGLNEGMMYYYRAYVKQGNTYYYGSIKTFTTKSTEGETPVAVDLGLSVKWADRNVGATQPEQDGDFYAWGDTLVKRSYTKVTYLHNVNDQYLDISTNISASQWDISTRKFGGCWRMPTDEEMRELISNCKWTWGTKDGVQGYWVENTATYQKIFLPAAGYREITYNKENDTQGYYWTATPNGSATSSNAYRLGFSESGYKYSNNYETLFTSLRELGLTIRPVYQSNAQLGTRDIFIRTDSISYAANRTQNTLWGTMLGLQNEGDNLTQGFVVGTSTDVEKGAEGSLYVEQQAVANGPYSCSLTDEQLKTLVVGDVYYVRAYVTDGTNISYGKPLEMTDYTFFTDSVKWGLGNEGHLYAHVKGVKPAEGLEVGFYYATSSDMSDKKAVRPATLEWKDDPSLAAGNAVVFTGYIDTVKVGTYYYQAYTKYQGVIHTGKILSFGAELIDLGLSSGNKWVNINLGTDNNETAGDGYYWGETAPRVSETALNKQNGDYTVSADREFIGGTVYDAVHQRLGTMYRLPSIDNINELINECTWTWDVNGYIITGKNGNKIFLPLGNYWTSQQGSGDNTQATTLKIDTTNRTPDKLEARQTALLMRPILNPHKDVHGQGGNAGSGQIGGGIEGNE